MKVEVAVEGDRIGNGRADENLGSVPTAPQVERRFGRVDRPDERATDNDAYVRVAGQPIVSELRRGAVGIEREGAAQAVPWSLVVKLQILTIGDRNRIRRGVAGYEQHRVAIHITASFRVGHLGIAVAQN